MEARDVTTGLASKSGYGLGAVPNYNDETVADVLDGIQHRRYVLPAIQREFVWGPDRMCALFDSLMRDYPISSLLYWHVNKENSDEFRWYDFVLNYHELDAPECPPHHNLPREDRIAVLDGQQRLTALNIGLRGSHAAHAKWRRYGRPQSYPRKHLFLDICAQPRLSEDRSEDQVYRFEFLDLPAIVFTPRCSSASCARSASRSTTRPAAVIPTPPRAR